MAQAKLASKIAKVEGKKHEASVGDIREILKIQEKLFVDDIASGDLKLFSPWFFSLVARLKKRGVKIDFNVNTEPKNETEV